jgi:UDP-glucose 4-epimerase
VEQVRVRSLDDAEELERGLAGCRAVVHLAARVHVMREAADDPDAAFRSVNVDGTRAVLEAAQRAGVARLVFLSSVKVLGEGRPEPYSASDEPRPQDAYGRSKLAAEQLLERSGSDLEWVVLRSPLVYGPGVGGNFSRLLKLASVARRLPLPLASVGARRSMVFVGNLVDAILHSVASPGVIRRKFLVSDDADLTVPDLLLRIALAGGFTPRMIPFPVGGLRLAGRLIGRSQEIQRLTESLTVDPSAFLATGWRPPFGIDEAIERTTLWWLAKERADRETSPT